MATQAKALFDNRVAVGLEFAKPENSAGLTLADAFQAGKAALDLVTSDPASVAQAIATFATSTTVSAATVGFDFSADASADPDASSNELVGISTANDVDQYAVM